MCHAVETQEDTKRQHVRGMGDGSQTVRGDEGSQDVRWDERSQVMRGFSRSRGWGV